MNSVEESRLPLTDHWAMAPLSNGRCQMAAPRKVTPGIMTPSMKGLRAFSGISATCWVVTTPEREAVCVSSMAASAVTSTDSVTAPTSRLTSIPATLLTSRTTFSRTYCLNPDTVTVTR